MTQIIGGLISGIISVLVLVILIEKSHPTLRKLAVGHYVFTDIMCTYLAYTLLPVVGLATIVNAGVFCLLFTLYLQYKRKSTKYLTIKDMFMGGSR